MPISLSLQFPLHFIFLIIQYEGANIGVNANTWNASQTYPVTFRDCLNMMFIDAIWMGVMSWYVAKIWPSEFGTHQPFYFICMPRYWMSCFGFKGKVFENIRNVSQEGGILDADVAVEQVTENLERQVGERTCVDIVGLYKEFKTTNGKKVAVDGLNLTMYSGQITALLGHNGAGKVRSYREISLLFLSSMLINMLINVHRYSYLPCVCIAEYRYRHAHRSDPSRWWYRHHRGTRHRH